MRFIPTRYLLIYMVSATMLTLLSLYTEEGVYRFHFDNYKLQDWICSVFLLLVTLFAQCGVHLMEVRGRGRPRLWVALISALPAGFLLYLISLPLQALIGYSLSVFLPDTL